MATPGTRIGQLPSRKSRYFPNTCECYIDNSYQLIVLAACFVCILYRLKVDHRIKLWRHTMCWTTLRGQVIFTRLTHTTPPRSNVTQLSNNEIHTIHSIIKTARSSHNDIHISIMLAQLLQNAQEGVDLPIASIMCSCVYIIIDIYILYNYSG